MQFITVRQFSAGDKTLPPLHKSRWWIPTATKLLALISKYLTFNSYNLLPQNQDLKFWFWGQNAKCTSNFRFKCLKTILFQQSKNTILKCTVSWHYARFLQDIPNFLQTQQITSALHPYCITQNYIIWRWITSTSCKTTMFGKTVDTRVNLLTANIHSFWVFWQNDSF